MLGHKERRCGMRLIDADELKKKLWCPTETWITGNIVTEEEIDETPTAYDIDKVVGQLEKRASQSCAVLFAAGIEEAISIIKAGEQE